MNWFYILLKREFNVLVALVCNHEVIVVSVKYLHFHFDLVVEKFCFGCRFIKFPSDFVSLECFPSNSEFLTGLESSVGLHSEDSMMASGQKFRDTWLISPLEVPIT